MTRSNFNSTSNVKSIIYRANCMMIVGDHLGRDLKVPCMKQVLTENS